MKGDYVGKKLFQHWLHLFTLLILPCHEATFQLANTLKPRSLENRTESKGLPAVYQNNLFHKDPPCNFNMPGSILRI